MFENFVHYLAKQFNDGGSFMWVILIIFASAGAVIVERIVYLYFYCNTNVDSLYNKLKELLGTNKIEEARRILGKRNSPLHILLRTIVERHQSKKGFDHIQAGVEEVAIKEIPKISQRINYLLLIANIATLTGLLGTIMGLQVSFGSLGTVDAAQKAAALASGIAQAMNATAFGLIVAVTCMITYTILKNKQESVVRDIDQSVVRFMNFMKETV